MKYLTYILDSPIQPESFIPETRGLRELTTLAVLPAAAVGLVFLAVLIPGAAVMDTARYIRLTSLRRNKRANLRNYARCVIISLGHEPTEEKIRLLIAA